MVILCRAVRTDCHALGTEDDILAGGGGGEGVQIVGTIDVGCDGSVSRLEGDGIELAAGAFAGERALDEAVGDVERCVVPYVH